MINSAIDIPGDAFDSSEMRFLWISLKASINTYTEGNIRPACCEVQ
jgi:hypothetical protein